MVVGLAPASDTFSYIGQAMSSAHSTNEYNASISNKHEHRDTYTKELDDRIPNHKSMMTSMALTGMQSNEPLNNINTESSVPIQLFDQTSNSDPIAAARYRLELCHKHLEVFLQYNEEIFEFIRKRISYEIEYHRNISKSSKNCYAALTDMKHTYSDNGKQNPNERLVQEFYAPIDAWRRCVYDNGRERHVSLKHLNSVNELVESSFLKLQEISQLRKVIKSQWEKKIKEFKGIEGERSKLLTKLSKQKDEFDSLCEKSQYRRSSRLNSVKKQVENLEKHYFQLLEEYQKATKQLFFKELPEFFDNYLKSFVGLEALARVILESVQDIEQSNGKLTRHLFRGNEYSQTKLNIGLQGLEKLVRVCKDTLIAPGQIKEDNQVQESMSTDITKPEHIEPSTEAENIKEKNIEHEIEALSISHIDDNVHKDVSDTITSPTDALYDPEPIMQTFHIDTRNIPYVYQICLTYIKNYGPEFIRTSNTLIFGNHTDDSIREADHLFSLYQDNAISELQRSINNNGKSLLSVSLLLLILLKQSHQTWISVSAGHYLNDTFKSSYQLTTQQIVQRLRFFASFLNKDQQAFMYTLLNVLASVTTMPLSEDTKVNLNSPPPPEPNDQLESCAHSIGTILFPNMVDDVAVFTMKQLVLHSKSLTKTLGGIVGR